MAENTTLARPYARAAFEVARSSAKLDLWMQILTMAAQVSQSPKVRALLASPSIAATRKGATLVELLGGSLDGNVQNFLAVLADNDRLTLLPEIAQLFFDMKTQYEKRVEVEVISAYPLGSKVQEKLLKALQQKLEREVTLSSTIDKNLLGGAVIRAGDTVIDGSVRGRLSRLADALHA